MAGFWGKRKREQQAQDADLARRAEQALVVTDERIRTTTDELAFAEAELGTSLTKDLRLALESVKTHMGEAFYLNQLNHDEIPDTPEELRTRHARILQLCDWADDLLDEKTDELSAMVARVRRAPEIIARVRQDSDALLARIPHARELISRMNLRYAPGAVRQISASADEAAQLITFARHGADVSERRRTAGQNEEANLALETATEAVRRAEVLLDQVEDFEIESLRAESTLAEVVADSRADLIAARTAPRVHEVRSAIIALEQALEALVPPGHANDPFAELTALRRANEGLDAAVANARHREANPLPTVAHVQHSLDDADRQLGVARGLIAGHRGWIGADARTRLAEAERLRIDIPALIHPETTREQALHGSRRVAQLASEALQLAQHDIDASRPSNDWSGGARGGSLAHGVLGGLVIGNLLNGLFD